MLVFAPLLLLLLPSSSSAVTLDDNGQCVRERVAGGSFWMTAPIDPAAVKPASCIQACADLQIAEVTLAGIAEGSICVCGGNETSKGIKSEIIFLYIRRGSWKTPVEHHQITFVKGIYNYVAFF